MFIEPYTTSQQALWDEFVLQCKNATFLHLRNYMDYHSDRFIDHSLIIYNDKKKIIGLVPGNHDGITFQSHAGLTYGGLLINSAVTTPLIIDMFEEIVLYLKTHHYQTWHYKTIPTIYHLAPAEEDRYVLFLAKASVVRRDVLSVVDNQTKLSYQERRRRMINRAMKIDCVVRQSEEFAAFWEILANNLKTKYNRAPVHTLSEILLLQKRFPEQIKLFCCFQKERMLAGVVIFETKTTAHTQYIAANEEGKTMGGLDLIFDALIRDVYSKIRYFDFGTSNEHNGARLNKGLIDHKEGFGARTIVHDHYTIDLRNFASDCLRNALQ